MAGALLKPNLPENALCNVRHEVGIYFGQSNNLDDSLIDSLIDEVVKDVHRFWHPSWTKKYLDINMPVAGWLVLPVDYKKLFEIRNQSFATSGTGYVQYVRGTDYNVEGYNNQAPPRRLLRWITPPSTALAIRIWFYRKPKRAKGDNDLVDLENDATDLIKVGCKMKYMAKKSNLDEYDRLAIEYRDLKVAYRDDDTEPDLIEKSVPYQADMQAVDFQTGELAS